MEAFVLDKYVITKRVLGLIDPTIQCDAQLLKLNVFKWWVNIRKDGGLALTELGEEAFEKANIMKYSFTYPQSDFNSMSRLRMMFVLDQRMLCPYSISYQNQKMTINIYDSRIAVTITLYGHFNDYLDTIEKRSNVKTK